MIVLLYFVGLVIFDLKELLRQYTEVLFFVSQKLLFPTLGLLLHPGLIVIYRFLCYSLIEVV